MSRRQIIVTIEPHEDGKCCGECKYHSRTGYDMQGAAWCSAFQDEPAIDLNASSRRLHDCLAAESKYTALIEAGERLARTRGVILADDEIAWDRAVEA